MRDPLLVPRVAAFVVGPLVAGGEVVRQLRLGGLPARGIDELLVGLALVAAAAVAGRDRGRTLCAAWAFAAGAMLIPLVESGGSALVSDPQGLALAALFAGAAALALSIRREPPR